METKISYNAAMM